ncbi:MAG: L,D-transpeptidase family protein [Aquabacterium sp.]|jgi:murein L,D-transpeptidase YafK|uniref:L,D-transpeptidase family protein n=1 Tax=Aquabacterium sp. TaxID=1872578 RepID=UPI003CFD0789|nr:L,D-transpeptidase family protein [Aquabacterium sp.]
MKYVSRRTPVSALLLSLALGLCGSAAARDQEPSRARKTPQAASKAAPKVKPQPAPAPRALPRQSASAEARLLEIYRLIGSAQADVALGKAESLVRDVPNFQLAQLVYGDLLLARTHALPTMGNAPAALAGRAQERLTQLRVEANRRLTALRERPPEGSLPAQFISLPSTTRHAIAVDASRSRLYLFQNGPDGLRLIADHYASIGKLGPEKSFEGDQRTPLGVYYITSRLDARQLTDFYGAGALPLNYPNEYDRRLGRTGSGIWLHGVPSDSYARSPESTDGCVALANPELQSILDQVQPRTTPVVIARSLQWVTPTKVEPQRRSLQNMIEGWRVARASGDIGRVMSFYSPQFSSGKQDFTRWRQSVERDVSQLRGKAIELKDLAILGWQDKGDILVVTFGEVAEGQRTGSVKRQYWGKEGGLWKIFYEGVIG